MSNFSITAKTASAFQVSNPWDSAEDSDHGGSGGSSVIQSTSIAAGSTTPPSYNNIIASTSHESLPQFPSTDNMSAYSATAPMSNNTIPDDPWSTRAPTFNNGSDNPSSSTSIFTNLEDASNQYHHYQASNHPLNRSQLPRLSEYRLLDKIKVYRCLFN